jgi:dihydrofolate reductase
MNFHIIAAIAKNRVIGYQGDPPWFHDSSIDFATDLARFKRLTLDNTVVMGRKTYDSIIERIGHPLSKRENIVITRNKNFNPMPGVIAVNSIEDAVSKSREIDKPSFIIGGGQIYDGMMKFARHLHLTHINKIYSGDTHFPELKKSEWDEVSREKHPDFDFVDYKRTYWSA